MNPRNIDIRPANLEDIDAMVGLLEQLFVIEEDFDFNPENHRKGLFLMLNGCSKHKSVQVAVKEGRVIGMCTVQTRISTVSGNIAAVLEDMVIDKAYRHRGTGTQMLRHMEKWALKRGINHLQLLADRENHPALSFYKANNWDATQLICLFRTLS